MASNLHGGPVSPWPRRIRRLVRGCALLLATCALALVVSLTALVLAYALGPFGLSVVSLTLAISTVVLFLLRGLGPLTVAFGCATLVVVASQAAGLDFLVAGWVLWVLLEGREVVGL